VAKTRALYQLKITLRDTQPPATSFCQFLLKTVLIFRAGLILSVQRILLKSQLFSGKSGLVLQRHIQWASGIPPQGQSWN
jgi:hypothetical protein